MVTEAGSRDNRRRRVVQDMLPRAEMLFKVSVQDSKRGASDESNASSSTLISVWPLCIFFSFGLSLHASSVSVGVRKILSGDRDAGSTKVKGKY